MRALLISLLLISAGGCAVLRDETPYPNLSDTPSAMPVFTAMEQRRLMAAELAAEAEKMAAEEPAPQD